ncbi:hypothetical protein GJ744_009996 [Endocarpon pusillum]|uniref:Uncharacterized protein n=1 Tax=Endocarpon pusillum TaxID=364733 RepID=A0A8H7AIX5_9EURO|nr:hypothetical protein GJ744_009996 [Endocarpon pusillum]
MLPHQRSTNIHKHRPRHLPVLGIGLLSNGLLDDRHIVVPTTRVGFPDFVIAGPCRSIQSCPTATPTSDGNPATASMSATRETVRPDQGRPAASSSGPEMENANHHP